MKKCKTNRLVSMLIILTMLVCSITLATPFTAGAATGEIQTITSTLETEAAVEDESGGYIEDGSETQEAGSDGEAEEGSDESDPSPQTGEETDDAEDETGEADEQVSVGEEEPAQQAPLATAAFLDVYGLLDVDDDVVKVENASTAYNTVNNAVQTAFAAGENLTILFDAGTDSLEFTQAITMNFTALANDVTLKLVSETPFTLYNGSALHFDINNMNGRQLTMEFVNVTLDGKGNYGGISFRDANPHLRVVNPQVNHCKGWGWGTSGSALAVLGTGSAGSVVIQGGSFVGNKAESGMLRANVHLDKLASAVVEGTLFQESTNAALTVSKIGVANISGTFLRNGNTDGSAITSYGCGDITINGIFEGNESFYGAVNIADMANTKLTLGGTYTNNTAYAGAAVFIEGNATGGMAYPVTIQNAVFRGNRSTGPADGTGGAVVLGHHETGRYIWDANIINCVFDDNAGKWGSGVYQNTYGTVTYTNCQFTRGNSVRGAAVTAYKQKDTTFTNCTFSDNTATMYGGALYFQKGGQDGNLTLTNCTFTRNTAENQGGAVCHTSGDSLVVNGGVFTNNTVDDGFAGAIYSYADSITIGGAARFAQNYASKGGGAIATNDAGGTWEDLLQKMTIGVDVTFADNEADEGYWMDDVDHIAIHEGNVDATSFTVPFRHAYNNYDVYYAEGELYVPWVGVTYRYNYAGAPNAGVYNTATVGGGKPFAAPAEPTRTGYSFTGWYTGTTATPADKWNFATDAFMASGDLYAGWRINSYTVTYVYNDGTDLTRLAPANFGSLLARPESPTRSGHTFEGWTRADGTVWNFDNDTMPAGHLTLTARWKAEPATSQSSSSSSERQVESSTSSTPSGGSTSVPASSASSARVFSAAPTSGQSTAPASAPVSQPASVASEAEPPTPDVEIQPEQTPGTVNLFGNDIPLGLNSREGWSLVNLLVALVLLASAVWLALRTLMAGKNQAAEEEEDEDDLGGLVYTKAKIREKAMRSPLRWAAILAGALPLVLFLLLEKFTYMTLLSAYTPFYVIFAAAHVGLALASALRIKRLG